MMKKRSQLSVFSIGATISRHRPGRIGSVLADVSAYGSQSTSSSLGNVPSIENSVNCPFWLNCTSISVRGAIGIWSIHTSKVAVCFVSFTSWNCLPYAKLVFCSIHGRSSSFWAEGNAPSVAKEVFLTKTSRCRELSCKWISTIAAPVGLSPVCLVSSRWLGIHSVQNV